MFRLSLAFVLIALSVAAPALGSGFSVAWQAPASCGTEREFEAGVARVVGKPLSELDSPWKSADVAIAERAGVWHLRVRVTSERGARRAREVSASTCPEAVEAAELIVATSLSAAPTAADSAGTADVAAASNAGEEPHPMDTAPARAADTKGDRAIETAPPRTTPHANAAPAGAAPRSHEPAPSPPAWTLGARVGLEPGLLPSATSFGALAVGLESRRLRGELSLHATYPESSSTSGVGTNARLYSADLLGCYGERAPRFFIWGCLGGEAGAFYVKGEPSALLPTTRSQTEPWLAGLAQLELGRELGAGISLALGATGMATTRRIHVLQHQAQTDENTLLYSTRAADLRPFLELAGRFR